MMIDAKREGAGKNTRVWSAATRGWATSREASRGRLRTPEVDTARPPRAIESGTGGRETAASGEMFAVEGENPQETAVSGEATA